MNADCRVRNADLKGTDIALFQILSYSEIRNPKSAIL